MGWCVYVSDRSEISLTNISTLNDLDVNWEHKTHTYNNLPKIHLVVKSPGIPDDIELVLGLKRRGISIISEIEFAGMYNNAKTICVTGSNGKTTTVKWIYSMLQNA